jgi:hypothetical protein
MAADGLGRIRMALAACGAALGMVFAMSPAQALDELAHEAAGISACEHRLCAILVGRDPKGDDLRCELTKTWARSTIKDADSTQVRWGFGDARCSAKLDVSRSSLVTALAGGKKKFFLPPQRVDCVVEQEGKVRNIKVVAAPKIAFRDGQAEKIWINLMSVEGPSAIRQTIQTAAELEDKLGLFHRQMVKQVNRFITRHCPQQQALALEGAAKDKHAKVPPKKRDE